MHLHPADELAYEREYLEADPMNLDGRETSDMRRGTNPRVLSLPAVQSGALSYATAAKWLAEQDAREEALPLSKLAETVSFYEDLMTKPRFAYFMRIDDRGYGTRIREALQTAQKAISENNWHAARHWMRVLTTECEELDDRISDLASD